MSGYRVFSRFYDGLTFNVDYKSRADYIESIMRELRHDMGLSLDLACGTGSLTCELKSRGVDIYGIDGSHEMLTEAMDKAYDKGLEILFLCQQMQSIDLYGTIDTCICTLDSLNHLTDVDDVRRTFERVSLFMNPGGVFLFDVNTVYKHEHVLGSNTFVYDTSNVFCVWQNSLKENNIVSIELDLFERDGGVYHRHSERFKERAYPIDQLSEMLDKAGFELVAVYDDMTTDPLRDDSERAVFVAKKRLP